MRLATLCLGFFLPIVIGEDWTLRVLHTNDMHSNYDPLDKDENPCYEEDFDHCDGGVSRIVGKVKELSESHDTIFLNGGDSTRGSLYFYLFGYKFIGQIYSQMDYNAVTLGNHEFDEGLDGIAEIMENLEPHVKMVVCNVDFHGDKRLANIVPSTIIEVGSHKVGIIGYTTTETFSNMPPEYNITFTEEAECVEREAKKLKEQGVNVILGLGHSGYKVDQKLCEEIPELTAVIGAHDHYLLANSSIAGDSPKGPYPTIVTRSDGTKCPVVQGYYISKFLGQIDLTIDDQTGETKSWNGYPILMTPDIEADKTMEAFLKPYRERVEREGRTPIGTATVNLDNFDAGCGWSECNFGNLATDAMVSWFVNIYAHENDNDLTETNAWSDVSAAFLDSRPIRINLRGDLTLRDLAAQFFFNYKMMLLNLTGQELLNVFEASLHSYKPNSQGYTTYLQVSANVSMIDASRVHMQKLSPIWQGVEGRVTILS